MGCLFLLLGVITRFVTLIICVCVLLFLLVYCFCGCFSLLVVFVVVCDNVLCVCTSIFVLVWVYWFSYLRDGFVDFVDANSFGLYCGSLCFGLVWFVFAVAWWLLGGLVVLQLLT